MHMRVGRLLGIDLEIDWSWLVALLLLTWFLSGPEGPFIPFDPRLRVVIALVVVVSIVGSVLLHELAHAAVARRCHLAVDGIKLFLFGGVSRMTGSVDSGREELLIAAAGLAATAAVAAIVFAGALQMPEPVRSIGLYLAYANALLVAFNLLPAYPLDGGRVARAASWALSGDRNSATRSTIAMSRGV